MNSVNVHLDNTEEMHVIVAPVDRDPYASLVLLRGCAMSSADPEVWDAVLELVTTARDGLVEDLMRRGLR